MPSSAKPYGSLPAKMLAKEVSWLTDTIKVALAGSGYTPNQDTHDYFSDVTDEVVATGYTAGGATLSGKTVTYDPVTNTLTADAGNVSWPDSTITARWGIVYASTGNAATSPLIGLVDFGENMASDDGPFGITWADDGVLIITVVG